MATDRRFTDEQVREIFRMAALSDAGEGDTEPEAGGMTLAEIQDIGAQVGLTPETISRAARGIDPLGELVQRPTVAGVPVGVARSFALGRKVSQQEWERLVLTLRRTFHARGKTQSEGGLREWWNGNLRVTIEPTAEGDVMYLYTANSASRAFFGMGAALTALAAVVFVVLGVTGQLAGEMSTPLMLLFIGLGQMAAGALRLPGWLSRRTRQFEAIGEAVVNARLTPGEEPPAG